MDVCPTALYSLLLEDLTGYIRSDSLSIALRDDGFWPGASISEAAAVSIARSFLKKYQGARTDVLDQRALELFSQVNLRCEEWKLQLVSSWDEILYGELQRSLYDFWYSGGFALVYHDFALLDRGRCGPGAGVGARGNDFYSKMFSSPLTCTRSDLYKSYRRYIEQFPTWNGADLMRQNKYGDCLIVEGNRLNFVPKNDKISRTICVEPTLNMFYQLGFGSILEERLQDRYGISMTDQPFKNRDLARLGSLTGRLSTIDLSSASDSMSLSMLRSALPRDFFSWLIRLRSRTTTLPSGVPLEMHMVSTMGNGFTFPLQTVLFSCVVDACARACGVSLYYPRGNDSGNFGVFGDDIICPSEITRHVLRLLNILGFQINAAKTFVEGPFRESCGEDYFRGVNIRGVYVKRLSTQQDRYAVINQLNLFSTRTGIRLSRVVQRLLRSVRYNPVPRYESDDAGIRVPFDFVRSHSLRCRDTGSTLYYPYRALGVKIRVFEDRLKVPKRHKPLIFNPEGLWISNLQRSVNAGSIGVRHDPVRYKRKLGVAPYWDASPTIHPLSGWFPWQRWNTAVYLNLFG